MFLNLLSIFSHNCSPVIHRQLPVPVDSVGSVFCVSCFLRFISHCSSNNYGCRFALYRSRLNFVASWRKDIQMKVCASLSPSLCLSVSVCLCLYLSVCLCLSVCLSVSLCVPPSPPLSQPPLSAFLLSLWNAIPTQIHAIHLQSSKHSSTNGSEAECYSAFLIDVEGEEERKEKVKIVVMVMMMITSMIMMMM